MVFIIHHWDIDGIASAAIVGRILEKRGVPWENTTPIIGHYTIDKELLKEIEKHDEVYVLDWNIDYPEVLKIKEAGVKKIIFIDHHKAQGFPKDDVIAYINPIAFGKTEKEYPSASWVVSDLFSFWNHLSALGVVGDIGLKKILQYGLQKKIESLLSKVGLTLRDSLELVSLVDSNSIVGNRKGVIEAVDLLMNKSPRDLLNYKPWGRNVERIEKAIKDAIENVFEENGVAILVIEEEIDLVSKLARKLVWGLGYKAAIVANRKPINGILKAYLRISPLLIGKINVLGLIDELKKEGLQAGGKADVVGVNVSSEEDLRYVLEKFRRVVNDKRK